MGHPVLHFQIEAKDDVASANFYCELFEWKTTPIPNMPYHTISTEGKEGIQGGIAKVSENQPAGVTFYVEVPDVAESLKKAESLGAKIVQPATQVMPDLTLGMFVDLEGRNVGLSTMLRPPKPKALKVKAASDKKSKKTKSKAKDKGKKKKKGKKK
jgi:predicted enzyme related to lactoylglutathione lyase